MATFRLLQKVCRKHLVSPCIYTPLFTLGRLASSQVEKSKWPDDGLGLGNYPNLPDISAQTKSSWGWWDIQERRNFGDSLHEADDEYNVWMYDAPQKSLYPPHEALRHLLTMFALVGGFVYVGYLYGKTEAGNRNKYTAKQFPYNVDYEIYKNGDPKQRLKMN